MKLSEQIDLAGRHRKAVSLQVDDVLIFWAARARELEADSAMLDDLIEMLKQQVSFSLTDWNGSYEWLLATRGKLYEGHTPREAIAAAIKSWKENK